MKRFRFLKSVCFLALVITSLTNCSSDDSKDENSQNLFTPRMTLKINDIDYSEYNLMMDGYEPVYTISWKKTENKNGTFSYTISGFIQGTNNHEYLESINIDLGRSVQTNQVFDSTNKSFSIDVDFLSKQFYFTEGITTGQLKITSFDGKTMSGEFSFNKLKSDYVSMPFINITKGVFKNIPNEIDL